MASAVVSLHAGERMDSTRGVAVILGASVNGLSFVRSLARRGVCTLLLDSERLVGTFTRLARATLLPDVERHPDAWLEYLQAVGSRLHRPGTLFATSDAQVVFLAQHRDEIAPHYRFLTPSAEAVERIVNKRLQYDEAQRVGVPIPATRFPESVAEARALACEFTYPCILKPYTAHIARRKSSKKVSVARSRAELVAEYQRLAAEGVPYMVQEIIPGGDQSLFGYLAFWDAAGREHSWLTKRKLRQNPPLYGDGSLQITVDAPEVADLSRRILKGLGYRGFVGVEFKLDTRDQRHKLMEINPRTVSGNQLAISAGVDFPWIGYEYLNGQEEERPSPSSGFRCGVKYVNEEWDIKAYLALRKSGELTLRGWWNSIRDAEARALWMWNDPLPLGVALGRSLRALVARGVSTLRRNGALAAAKIAHWICPGPAVT
jgi:predicted ATP-grasp superfamily ATP-dependent carboligase